MSVPDPSTRWSHVDSLRAVAALLVVWTHATDLFVDFQPREWTWLWDLTKTADLGRIGVIAFFGVSGFLIPNSLQGRGVAGARTFVVRRVFRLFPAFWISVPLGVLTIWALFDKPIGWADVLLNLTMTPAAFGATPVMGLYWTLTYELAFYGICLGLFLLGLLHRRGVLALMLAACVTAFGATFGCGALARDQALMDLGIVFLNASALFLGAVWRQWLEGGLRTPERLVLLGALGTFWLIIPAASAYVLLIRGLDNPFFVTLPIAYGAGVGLFIAMTSVAKVRWRPLAWIGLVSYSLYLLHPVVIYPMVFLLRGTMLAHVAPPPVWIAIGAVLSIGLAAAAFYAVEQPGIALGRRLTRPTGSPSRRSAPDARASESTPA